MTREEEIIEAASEYSEYEFNECAANNGFIKGAQWADKTMIEKACEYAEARYDLNYCENVKDIISYLKSLMEE